MSEPLRRWAVETDDERIVHVKGRNQKDAETKLALFLTKVRRTAQITKVKKPLTDVK